MLENRHNADNTCSLSGKALPALTARKAIQRSKEFGYEELLLQHLIFDTRSETIKLRNYRALNAEQRKQHLSQEQAMHSYHKIACEVRTYKIAFGGLAGLFFFLGLFALSHNLILTTALFGSFMLLPKILIAAVCFVLSLAALALSLSVCRAKELTKRGVQKACYNLRQLYYCDAEEEFCLQDEGLTVRQNQKQQRFFYHNGMQAIQEKQAETITLLKKIQKSKRHSSQDKDVLCVQAIERMENNLLDIVEWSCQKPRT